MARTESKMIELKSIMPEFKLPNVKENFELFDSKDIKNKPVLIMFICNHCPFVIHLNFAISDFAKEYISKGIEIIAINSNDIENYQDDSPEKMVEQSKKYNFIFPYLLDESQEVAKKFNAACTPDFFLYNENLELVYRGQFDDSRPGNNLDINGMDLKNACESVLNKENPIEVQKPSVGCNIKWKN